MRTLVTGLTLFSTQFRSLAESEGTFEGKNDADLKTWCGFISYSHCSLLLQGPQLPNLKPQHRSLSKTPAKGEAKAKSQLATYTPAIPPLVKGSISSHRGAKLDARTARVVLHRMEILVPV